MGMVFAVNVTGAGPEAGGQGFDAAAGHDEGMDNGASGHSAAGDGGDSAADDLDFMAEPGADFAARDATLPPADEATTHRKTFTVSGGEREGAGGAQQQM